jgi:hypothetical protein
LQVTDHTKLTVTVENYELLFLPPGKVHPQKAVTLEITELGEFESFGEHEGSFEHSKLE